MCYVYKMSQASREIWSQSRGKIAGLRCRECEEFSSCLFVCIAMDIDLCGKHKERVAFQEQDRCLAAKRSGVSIYERLNRRWILAAWLPCELTALPSLGVNH